MLHVAELDFGELKSVHFLAVHFWHQRKEPGTLEALVVFTVEYLGSGFCKETKN